MSVTVNATGAEGHVASGTSFSYTGITVAAGSNSVLTVAFGFNIIATGITCVWDSGGTNQSMTSLQTASQGSGFLSCLFGLRSPTTGNKTLLISWTGSSECYGAAMAYDGADTSSDANAFPTAHRIGANAASGTTVGVTVTSASGNQVVAFVGSGDALSAQTQTSIFADSAGINCYAMQRGAGAASVICNWTQASSLNWASVGCEIAAASSGDTFANNGYLRFM